MGMNELDLKEEALMVYLWEDFSEWFSRNDMPLVKCKKLIKKARYRYNRPNIRVGAGKGISYAWGNEFGIELPRTTRSKTYVLHEAAHSIVGGLQGHNSIWLRVYIDLLCTYMGLSKRGLFKSARESNLQVAPLYKCPRPRSYGIMKKK